jgi:glutamate synthase domain-containing protein 1
MGNRNWMRAREALLASDLIPGDLERLYPICTPGASDSASFDEVLELLHLGGRTLPALGADDDPRRRGRTTARWTRSAARSTSSTRR